MPTIAVGAEPQLMAFVQRQPPGRRVILLEGARMRAVESALEEFARAMAFPEYFGRNFNALFDCLTDLDWLPATSYLLVIRNAELLLDEAMEDDLTALIDLLSEASHYWQKPMTNSESWDREARRFEVLYHTTPDNEAKLTRRLAAYDLPRMQAL